MTYHLYEARFEDCRSCPRKPECCPDNKKNGRSVAQLEESPVVMAFRKKMASEEVQQRYRRRGRIVEFCQPRVDQEQAGTATVPRAGA